MRLFATLFALLALGACATLHPDYEEPTVTLASIQARETDGMVPGFDVGLRILNPNASDLNLAGIVYTISINGHDLVKGVGKDFPVIEGYSEETVHLTASANLLAGVRMFMDQARNNGGNAPMEYAFEAKLDLAGPYPSLRLRETGILGGGRQSEP